MLHLFKAPSHVPHMHSDKHVLPAGQHPRRQNLIGPRYRPEGPTVSSVKEVYHLEIENGYIENDGKRYFRICWGYWGYVKFQKGNG